MLLKTMMTTDAPAQPVQTRLAEAYRELPEAMRRIADALMSDPLLGALWGIEAMSERAEVSVGTVVRFAKRLGYKGFSEFRDALREACHARSGDAELELMEAPSDVFGTLAEVARRDGENLQRLIQAVDQATLAAATRMLAEAHHRVILGRGVSHVMGLVLGFYLTQAGLPCIAAIPSDFSTQVANLDAQGPAGGAQFLPLQPGVGGCRRVRQGVRASRCWPSPTGPIRP